MKPNKFHPHIVQHCISAEASSKQGALPTILEQAKTIIIRHANSTFNNKWHSVEQEIEKGTAG
jgi:hypothetical protein